eukprot:TRINITY_DN27667_c1_g1_i1.p1 TRINITY_DN27667_c1_g1~~TRINITY_DN27667_c1_g1_i1.p1  ORF type:complete len:1874 (+),score=368.20 TRINITY_DN27667_c1_g1_i1:68-5689(+)
MAPSRGRLKAVCAVCVFLRAAAATFNYIAKDIECSNVAGSEVLGTLSEPECRAACDARPNCTVYEMMCGKFCMVMPSCGEQLVTRCGSTVHVKQEGHWFVSCGGCPECCGLRGACITSPAYPSRYPNGCFCVMEVLTPGVLHSVAFDIDYFDRLTVGAMEYKGSDGPQWIPLEHGQLVIWNSDRSGSGPGWELCLAPSPTTSPTAPTAAPSAAPQVPSESPTAAPTAPTVHPSTAPPSTTPSTSAPIPWFHFDPGHGMWLTGVPLPQPLPTVRMESHRPKPQLGPRPPRLDPALVVANFSDWTGAQWGYDGRQCLRWEKIVALPATDAMFLAVTNEGRLVTSWGHGYVKNFGSSSFQGKGVAAIASTRQAFAILGSDGSILDVWGSDTKTATYPSELRGTTGIAALATTTSSFAALHSNGTVAGAWGFEVYGGTLTDEIRALRDISYISGSGWSFCALAVDASVAGCWGWMLSASSTSWSRLGYKFPPELMQPGTVAELHGFGHYFIAINVQGFISGVWGAYGITESKFQGPLYNSQVSRVYGMNDMFFAVGPDDRVVGHRVSEPSAAQYTTLNLTGQKVAHIAASRHNMCLLYMNRTLGLCWGHNLLELPSYLRNRTDICMIDADSLSFVAVHCNGTPAGAWGDDAGGQALPDSYRDDSGWHKLSHTDDGWAALRVTGAVAAAWPVVRYMTPQDPAVTTVLHGEACLTPRVIGGGVDASDCKCMPPGARCTIRCKPGWRGKDPRQWDDEALSVSSLECPKLNNRPGQPLQMVDTGHAVADAECYQLECGEGPHDGDWAHQVDHASSDWSGCLRALDGDVCTPAIQCLPAFSRKANVSFVMRCNRDTRKFHVPHEFCTPNDCTGGPFLGRDENARYDECDRLHSMSDCQPRCAPGFSASNASARGNASFQLRCINFRLGQGWASDAPEANSTAPATANSTAGGGRSVFMYDATSVRCLRKSDGEAIVLLNQPLLVEPKVPLDPAPRFHVAGGPERETVPAPPPARCDLCDCAQGNRSANRSGEPCSGCRPLHSVAASWDATHQGVCYGLLGRDIPPFSAPDLRLVVALDGAGVASGDWAPFAGVGALVHTVPLRKCSGDHVAVLQGDGTRACKPCPEHLACDGSARTGLKRGYWRPDARSLEAGRCVTPHCLAVPIGGREPSCANGSTGALCGTCTEGYRLAGKQCRRCNGAGYSVGVVLAGFVGACVAAVCYLLANAPSWLRDTSLRDTVQVIVVHIQFLTLLPYYLGPVWGSVMNAALAGLKETFSPVSGAAPLLCLLPPGVGQSELAWAAVGLVCAAPVAIGGLAVKALPHVMPWLLRKRHAIARRQLRRRASTFFGPEVLACNRCLRTGGRCRCDVLDVCECGEWAAKRCGECQKRFCGNCASRCATRHPERVKDEILARSGPLELTERDVFWLSYNLTTNFIFPHAVSTIAASFRRAAYPVRDATGGLRWQAVLAVDNRVPYDTAGPVFLFGFVQMSLALLPMAGVFWRLRGLSRRGELSGPHAFAAYGVFYTQYRRSAYQWGLVSFAVRVLAAMTGSLLSSPLDIAYAGVCLHSVALALDFVLTPYCDPTTPNVSLSTVFITMLGGLWIVVRGDGASAVISRVFISVVNAVCMAYFLHELRGALPDDACKCGRSDAGGAPCWQRLLQRLGLAKRPATPPGLGRAFTSGAATVLCPDEQAHISAVSALADALSEWELRSWAPAEHAPDDAREALQLLAALSERLRAQLPAPEPREPSSPRSPAAPPARPPEPHSPGRGRGAELRQLSSTVRLPRALPSCLLPGRDAPPSARRLRSVVSVVEPRRGSSGDEGQGAPRFALGPSPRQPRQRTGVSMSMDSSRATMLTRELTGPAPDGADPDNPEEYTPLD